MSQPLASSSIRITVPIIVGGAGLAAMSGISFLLQQETLPMWTISPHKVVNFTLTMQLMVLQLSFLALAFMRGYNRPAFNAFFHFKLTGSTTDSQSEWRTLGPLVAVGFTFGNAMLMAMGVLANHGKFNLTFLELLPLVLLLSATNAWSEEIFSRFVIVSGLHGNLRPTVICWISAVLFGLPHFFGTPSGAFGVITSGFLGWLLAKSVIETKSLGWALLIHFLQDVIIFGSGAMIIAGQ